MSMTYIKVLGVRYAIGDTTFRKYSMNMLANVSSNDIKDMIRLMVVVGIIWFAA